MFLVSCLMAFIYIKQRKRRYIKPLRGAFGIYPYLVNGAAFGYNGQLLITDQFDKDNKG